MTYARVRTCCLTVSALLVLVLLACVVRVRGADDTTSAALAPLTARPGEPRAELTKSALNVSALQPGKPATIAVVLDVKPGFHAQSHAPLEDYLIKFQAKLKEHPAVKAGEPIYPAGEIIETKLLGKLSIYSGRVIVRIPLQVTDDAPLGPTKLTGTLHYQICDDGQCYQPETTPFSIDTEIVAADKAVQANEPDLFNAAAAVPAAAPPGALRAASAGAIPFSLISTLGFAFLVGITFNLVPCVLPVLPLKALGFYEVSQHNRARCILFGLSFSLGVIASFAVLGLFVIVLKTFTWGQLFSSPWFSSILAIILVAMALNMFGLFTINLPGGMYSFSPRHDTYFGNVLYGILTAALSTPCTFGLFVSLLATIATQPPHIGMLIITTVGAGMASPYVLLSAFPELARRFPRTGPWAEVMKQFMGFLLLAVAIFFVQGTLDRVVGAHKSWWLIFAVLAAGALFLVVRSIHYGKTWLAPTIASILALLIIAPSLAGAIVFTVEQYAWQPYDPKTFDATKAPDHVVLIDFTADWCANCKTVEALVINRFAVRQDVQRYKVQMIRADLTKESAPGWDLLHQLGGQGIPLTVIYSPSLKEPVKLPGIYKVEDLRAALARAAQPARDGNTAVARQ